MKKKNREALRTALTEFQNAYRIFLDDVRMMQEAEQALSPLLRSSLNMFRDLSSLALAFSMAVLARSRAVYWLTRPLAVKVVFVALALVPLFLLIEAGDTFVALALSAPYVIAFLMLGPTLARLLVKGVRWF